jgi:iron complex outermembrane receptor protein
MKWFDPRTLSRLGTILLGSSALGGLLVQAPPALAQGEGAGTTETIVVTARQREEAIQNVPAQVSAFTAATIEAKSIEMPRDYFWKVPNLNLVETQNIGNAFIVIRGIGQARNSEPSVSVIVDGVPQTQAAQFNQPLIDIQQIEVIKGPQGALYGRNAIGGAILIKTKQPTDEFEGKLVGGYENGPGGKAQGVISGPITDKLKFRVSASYENTSGHIENTFLNDKADPVTDVNVRLKFLYEPTDRFTIDLRGSMDRLYTQALYFNMVPTIPGVNSSGVNDTHLDVRVNNAGKNNRYIYDGSLKMDYKADIGTFTSITGYARLREILTGDAVNFVPRPESFFNFLGTGIACGQAGPVLVPVGDFSDALCVLGSDGITTFDWMQSQYLEVDQWTQEVRFTSPEDRRFRYIFGGQVFITNRYISTDNIRDDETLPGRVPAVYKTPRLVTDFPTSYNITFLADSQDQFAWAAYLDTSTSITDQLELSLNVRFDHDRRTNTTETPQCFLNSMFGSLTGGPPCVQSYPGLGPNVPLSFTAIAAHTGDKRKESWQAWQPQAILRYEPMDQLQLYASYSRGFRSGGFNQTGVGAVALANGIAGLNDLFDAEKANSYEVGFKSKFANGRVALNGSAFLTDSKNPYFFIFEVTTSTQNLGNIDKVRYQGFDLDLAVTPIEGLTFTGGFGFTDSEIKKFPDPAAVGNQAPLVSRTTANVGVQVRVPFSEKVAGVLNVDYSRIGKTWWEPFNVTVRNPVNLVDGTLALEAGPWRLSVWAKNIGNEIYNAEFSPSPPSVAPFVGDFVFKALPRRWGIDLTRKF